MLLSSGECAEELVGTGQGDFSTNKFDIFSPHETCQRHTAAENYKDIVSFSGEESVVD